MKTFKPKFYEIIHGIIPENTDDLFINTESLEYYRKSKKFWDRHCYEGLVLGFGKNVFVFDLNACEFFKEE